MERQIVPARKIQSPLTARVLTPVPRAPLLATVDATIWGPPLWKALHTAGQNKQLKTRQPLWANLMKNLRTGIPCPDCSAHFNAWMSAHPIRASLIPNIGVDHSKWILDLHNDVNRRTGKPVWTLAQVAAEYNGDLAVAREAAQTLQGILGDKAFFALMALLNSVQ
jgi:hypothetical protein